MTPKEIVQELGKHIVGQGKAKKAVAIALRNRWRRMQLPEDMRSEVSPKNILMIGATGVGKTEIARRLANMADAPFIKVEATKFTEVGYVGRDVESIIRDLMDVSIKSRRMNINEKNYARARRSAEKRILDALIATAPGGGSKDSSDQDMDLRREQCLKQLRDHELDNQEIVVEVEPSQLDVEVVGPQNIEMIPAQIKNLMKSLGGRRRSKKSISVARATKLFMQEECESLLDEDELKSSALEDVEQKGIVFIDEIDKLSKRSGGGNDASSSDISREGVQRDLLPLIEGSTVSTKHGIIKTDHILFIASGAFHFSKPSDLIPELQGRLPIRVELNSLTAKDFVRILVEPKASLIQQYTALLATEGCEIEFTDAAISRIADLAFQINQKTENIGARRLHTVMEHMLEDLSFDAPDMNGTKTVIDEEYVDRMLKDVAKDQDLSRYIL